MSRPAVTPGLMLVLFDIDGTLLATHGAGTRSMHAAAREMFGEGFTMEGVEIAGCIDPLIWANMARVNGLEDPGADHDRFRAAYARHLADRLAADHDVACMPGVGPLLEALCAVDGLTLGLLTGNYPETGRLKIEAAGLDPDLFAIAAWGCDGRTRRDLPGVAMARHRKRTGRELAPREVIIVGDTPHDVDCARTAECRSLAVATGTYARDELVESGADLVVDDLTPTGAILSWMLKDVIV